LDPSERLDVAITDGSSRLALLRLLPKFKGTVKPFSY
jgi:hypothetical protein